MNSFEFLCKRIVQSITEKIKRSETLNKEPLLEISRINLKEYGNTPFPTNKFEIKIWNNDHNPPHFHVIYNGWNISFTIMDGEELRTETIGKNSSDYNYIKKNVPIWLDLKCKILPMVTNRENAMATWQQLHE